MATSSQAPASTATTAKMSAGTPGRLAPGRSVTGAAGATACAPVVMVSIDVLLHTAIDAGGYKYDITLPDSATGKEMAMPYVHYLLVSQVAISATTAGSTCCAGSYSGGA